MATTGQEEFTLDTAAELAAEEGGSTIEGKSPWVLAGRRLRRNYVALGSLGVFILIVLACMLAPLYATHVSHIGPDDENASGYIHENGQRIPIISHSHSSFGKNGEVHLTPGGIPIGPQWGASGAPYFFGADGLGRDVGTRLLYGGRNSLQIGLVAAAITTVLSIILALVAAYFGSAPDWIISRFFDLIWAFPVVLLGIALGTALSIDGFHHDPTLIFRRTSTSPPGASGFRLPSSHSCSSRTSGDHCEGKSWRCATASSSRRRRRRARARSESCSRSCCRTSRRPCSCSSP